MKELQNNKTIIFIRTSKETKEEFLKAVEKSCLNQNTLGELLIKKGSQKIINKDLETGESEKQSNSK